MRERSEAPQEQSGSVWGGGGPGSLRKPEQDGYVTRAYLWRDTEALRHRYCEQTWDHGQKLEAEQRRGCKILGRPVTFTSRRHELLDWRNQLWRYTYIYILYMIFLYPECNTTTLSIRKNVCVQGCTLHTATLT